MRLCNLISRNITNEAENLFSSEHSTLYAPLFSTDFNRFRAAVAGSSPCFSQKLFRAFAKPDETEGLLNFFMSPKGQFIPLHFFGYFATN